MMASNIIVTLLEFSLFNAEAFKPSLQTDCSSLGGNVGFNALLPHVSRYLTGDRVFDACKIGGT